MDKLRHYFLSHFSVLFFSIFLPLFAIASVIFMIKLATYTAIIQLDVSEMGKLYLFILPELLFYTLPIAFVVGGALTLYRLSNDNETVIVFSLGVSPIFLAKIIFKPAFILTLFLLINFIIITPYINNINKNFLDTKKAEAKFNLSASEFGHNFGDWMLFINSNDEATHTFNDVVLFNKEMKDEIVISAKKAKLNNKNGVLTLHLEEGESYSYDNNLLKIILFTSININNLLDNETKNYKGALDYWTNNEKRERKDKLLVVNTLLSLFPLVSIFLMITLGVVHARHQKRWIYPWLFLSIVGYYSAAIITQIWFGFHAIWIVALVWMVITYAFYKRLVGSRF